MMAQVKWTLHMPQTHICGKSGSDISAESPMPGPTTVTTWWDGLEVSANFIKQFYHFWYF
jgi:hypothetical protein